MRVTGGFLKGKKLSVPGLGGVSDKGALRPTPAKVRAALFNILGDSVKGSSFCDLYAGSGTVGMEAMSRGAVTVYYVEADQKRAVTLEKMLDGCGCRPKARIVQREVIPFISDAASEGVKFDIVFMDPPYESADYDEVLALLGQGRVLSDDALVIAEHSKRRALAESYGTLALRKSYKYGDTLLAVYGRHA